MAFVSDSPRLTRLIPSFTTVVLVAILLRIVLILYSEWHDARSVVKYTDVDYRVFSDAAHFVLHPSTGNRAQGPLGRLLDIGDPYTRATYRYTPLLALLLIPNELLHPSFGKYLFAACDILAGLLMHGLLTSVILVPRQMKQSSPKPDQGKSLTDGGLTERSGVVKEDELSLERYATLLVSIHLLNPLVFTISTRGSSEAVLSVFVLSTLYCALRGRWKACAILLGLSTHWKIYPFIYGVACLCVIGGETGTGKGWNAYWRSIVNLKTVKFCVLSVTTFLTLGAAMYAIWGYPFLYESYLYHLHRLDHRHNFSPYFYLIYLTYPSPSSSPGIVDMVFWRKLLRSPLTSFVPQMILSLGAGLLFGHRKDDLAFAWFVQTVMFVVFNKVCTSQYFLWYTLFLPLAVPRLHMSLRRAVLLLAVWAGTQALWLSEAYRLEFLGENVFRGLWTRSLIYVVGNCWVLAELMKYYIR